MNTPDLRAQYETAVDICRERGWECQVKQLDKKEVFDDVMDTLCVNVFSDIEPSDVEWFHKNFGGMNICFKAF